MSYRFLYKLFAPCFTALLVRAERVYMLSTFLKTLLAFGQSLVYTYSTLHKTRNEVSKAFPSIGSMEIVMVGPQLSAGVTATREIRVDDQLLLRFIKQPYEEVDLPLPDLVYLCNSGIGDEKEGVLWKRTVHEKLLGSNLPAILTSFNDADFQQDKNLVGKLGCSLGGVREPNALRSMWTEVDNEREVQANFTAFATRFV